MTTTAPDPMQQVHPHQYPAAQTPTPNQPHPRRRWPWVLGIALAFFVGVGVGGASDTSNSAGGAPVAGDSPGIPDGVPLGMPEPVAPLAPVAPVEAPPPALPEPPPGPATTIAEGVYVVGEDIEPGTYKTAGPSDRGTFGMCYWARLSDTSGDFDSIIANGSPQGPGTVTISPSDGAFDTSGCELWTKSG